MPEKLLVVVGEVPEQQDIVSLARVVGPDNSTIVQSQANGSPPWSLDVYNLASSATPGVPVYSFTGSAASEVLFNSLQLDGYWSVDRIGYNFRHQLAQSTFTQAGGSKYRLEYVLNTSLWGPIRLFFELTVRSAQKV